MYILDIDNLSFTYPGSEKPALCDISLRVKQGDFVILSGETGCGKTTLLRCIKYEVRPFGRLTGEVRIAGEKTDDIDEKKRVSLVGYVMQEAEGQIVTDTVWHELSFGLESLGASQKEMMRKVSEISNFFGIQNWFRRKTTELSGGQKQILNLASAMIMKPEILLLDEPCSQLDPVAAEGFCDLLRKINRELGTTIIITEHSLDGIMGMADRVIGMRKGKVVTDGTPYEFAADVVDKRALPRVCRIYNEWCEKHPARKKNTVTPVDVAEARAWAGTLSEGERLELEENRAEEESSPGETVLSAKNVSFSYSAKGNFVINSLSLEVRKGETVAVLGGNGSGKTTLLKLLKGLIRPDRGRIVRHGTSVMVFQDPKVLFSENTVSDELEKVKGKNVAETVRLFEMEDILSCHPYDISGGEQHKTALSMALSADPDILFLDEPTRGLDAGMKEKLENVLKDLTKEGKAVILVSHDIEFCSDTADRCTMLFDGRLSEPERTADFFKNNMFYTTFLERILR